MRIMPVLAFVAFASSLLPGALAQAPAQPKPALPLKERAMKIFEANDKANPPKEGAAVFLGSSSIGAWGTLVKDMAPLPVVKRGVGGTKTGQMQELYELAVAPLKPKVIVYYCGDNDLTTPSSDPEAAFKNFVSFAERVKAELPKTKILFISVKPSEKRKAALEVQAKYNRMVKELCEKDKSLVYLAVTGATLAPDGKIRAEMLNKDGLHLNADGYAEWTRIVKPAVEKALAEAQSE